MADHTHDLPSTDVQASAPASRTMFYDPDATEPGTLPIAGATVFVGTGGDLVVRAMRDPAGTKTPFKNCPDGFLLPVRVKEIYGATDGTTASDIVVIW